MAIISTQADKKYTIELSGVQAFLLARAAEMMQEIDLATIGQLLTIPCDDLLEEAGLLPGMLRNLEVDGINSFVS